MDLPNGMTSAPSFGITERAVQTASVELSYKLFAGTNTSKRPASLC